jgi:hypothetical protein
MISRLSALTGSTATRTSLTYINSLVTGATVQGAYSILVPAKYMDNSMMNEMMSSYGYMVSPKNTIMGDVNDYLISWGP